MVYFVNIFFIFLWAFVLLKRNTNQTKKKVYCIIVALQWILISGLRHLSVGEDTDDYYFAFENGKNISWNIILSNCWDYLFGGIETKDPGYYLFQKIFQIFSDNYQLYLFVIAIIFTGLMARWIYKHSSMPELSFLVYSVLFYSFYSLTGHRQTIATALIFFLGYEYAKDKKFIKFAIVAFVAFMIHKSSLVFIPYLFIANIAITPVYVGVMSAVILLVTVLGDALYAPIAFFFGFGEEQIYYDGGGTSTFTLLMIIVCVVSFVLYPWVSKRREDAKNIYNLLFMTLMTTLLVMQQQSFMRVQQYYSMVIMLVIPEMVLSIKKEYRTAVYILGCCVMIAFLISTNPHYKFCWQIG